MQAQIEFVRSGQFQGFVAALPSLEEAQGLVHGIFIELHPLWCVLCDQEREARAGLWSYPWEGLAGWPEPLDPRLLSSRMRLPGGPYDVDQLPEGWKYVLDRARKLSPFLVKIYVLPTTKTSINLRRRVEELANQQSFFTAVIDAPVPAFALNVQGATDVHVTTNGILGGYMRDQNDPGQTVYGVTCAHVAQSKPGTFSLHDVGGQLVTPAGTIADTNYGDLVNVGPTGACNPYQSTSSANVDLALLALDSRLTALNLIPGIGTIRTHMDKTQLNSYSPIWHKGAGSWVNQYEIGGYGYMTKIIEHSTGNVYCFSDLFDFARTTNNRWQRGTASLPVAGDSGSWLIHDDGSGTKHFFGMLMAVEKARGIGMFASSIIDFARKKGISNNWGYDLILI